MSQEQLLQSNWLLAFLPTPHAAAVGRITASVATDISLKAAW